MSSRMLESLVGALVLGIAVWFFYDAYGRRSLHKGDMYILNARFDKADGLLIGSDVKISGVKVGTIRDLTLDANTYQAIVSFEIKKNIKLTQDTSAEVGSDGLLGSKHLRLISGNSDDMLAPNDFIENTQSLPSLEALIGQLIFSTQKKSDHEAAPARSSAP